MHEPLTAMWKASWVMGDIKNLVEREYTDRGITRTDAILMIHLRSGVSVQTVRSALLGQRIMPESARSLASWALVTHRVEIDVAALVTAPPRRRVKVAA